MYFFSQKKEHGELNTMHYIHRFTIFLADLARNLAVINFSFFFFLHPTSNQSLGLLIKLIPIEPQVTFSVVTGHYLTLVQAFITPL